MIVLWGVETEPALARVGAALATFGAEFVVLDHRRIRVGARALTTPDGRIDLRRVRAMYARPADSRSVADNASERVLWTWAEITPAVIVNRLSAMAANHSKPYQLASIRRAGFCVPPTLVTTSPSAARAFWRQHGEVIYKSVSGVRSVVSRLRPEHAERLRNVVWCPTQLQAFVAGREHRVHVVGERVFACEVVSDAVDYRYAETSVELRPCGLPHDVEDRCRRLAADQGLLLAGIDLRRTLAGEWYCFEVNPSPGFPYFEHASGPIAQAIARMLLTVGGPT
jgi:glutathione synthase/RimK-type ligase-like ATP-grasp enzyme